MALPVLETFLESDGGVVSSSTLTLDKPSGVVAGDLLILIGMNPNATGAAQFTDNKSGWTFIEEIGDTTSDCHIGAFWKTATGSEGASEDIVATASLRWLGFYLRISGHDTTTPINDKNFQLNELSATKDILEVTTTVDNCLAIYSLAFTRGDGFPFSVSGTGWAEDDEGQTSASGSGVSGCFGSKDQVTAGGTGTATVTPSQTAGASFFQIAIAPASDGVTGTGVGTFDEITGSAEGIVEATGTGVGTFDEITGSASGELIFKGTGVGNLDEITGDASGSFSLADVFGTGVGTLDEITGSASGELIFKGTGVGTFDEITGSAEGTFTDTGVSGTGVGTMDEITAAAAGNYTPLPVIGTGVGTLDEIAGSAAGWAEVFGVGVGDIEEIFAAAAGTYEPPTGEGGPLPWIAAMEIEHKHSAGISIEHGHNITGLLLASKHNAQLIIAQGKP